MKNALFLSLLSLIVCSVLLFGCIQTAATPNNLVAYALEVNNDILQPQGLEFGMTVEEVCKTRGLQIADLREDSENTTSLRRIITIEGLSDNVYEIFSFYNGKLISASYNAIVDETDFETLMATVMVQAEAFLPETMQKGDSRWTDSQGNWVSIGSGSTDEDSNKEVITLNISIPRTSLNGS